MSRILTIIFYLLVAISTFFITVMAQAGTNQPSATSNPRLGTYLSLGTIIFLIVGVVISAIYLQKMFAVLRSSAKTYESDQQDESKDTFNYSLLGTIISVTLSAVVIWIYGIGAFFLYLGPILCMLTPIALIYCMNQDLIRFKKITQPK